MITEIEVEGIGILRQLNNWQLHRLRRVRPADRHDAQVAMGLGMSIAQFRRQLSPEEQAECLRAWFRLMSPEANGIGPVKLPPRAPGKGEHVSLDRQISMGRKLIALRSKLPRGHFPRWVEENSGLSMSQAQRYISAARKAENRPLEQETA